MAPKAGKLWETRGQPEVNQLEFRTLKTRITLTVATDWTGTRHTIHTLLPWQHFEDFWTLNFVGVPQPKPMHGVTPNFQDMFTPRRSRAV